MSRTRVLRCPRCGKKMNPDDLLTNIAGHPERDGWCLPCKSKAKKMKRDNPLSEYPVYALHEEVRNRLLESSTRVTRAEVILRRVRRDKGVVNATMMDAIIEFLEDKA